MTSTTVQDAESPASGPSAQDHQSNGTANGKPLPYTASSDPVHKPRRMRLICIGAGLSGIAAAYKYQRQLEETDFVIYEKNPDVTGTWLENRYPGCACDIPAHAYTYSWEGNPEWSRFYVDAHELYAYYKGCAVKWNCMQYINLNHRVIAAKWQDTQSRWEVEVEQVDTGRIFTDSCDVLLSATGVLNKWKWPDIKGLETFQGQKMHSAHWDADYDFKDKRVAVIGAGSSAIQIVPSLQPIVSNMFNFIRSPTWITPEFSQGLAAQGRETVYTAEEIETFKTDKKAFLEYRKKLQNFGSASYPLYFKGSQLQQKVFNEYTELMRKRLDYNEELCAHLIPQFPVGCRRFTPGHGFLEALIKPNSTVVTTEIQSVTPTGIRTVDGVEYEVDAIVCATGFDVSQRPTFPVIGRHGLDLRDFWEKEPIHYMSVTVPGFPNYFITSGPNSPIANGSLISGLETEIDYAYACFQKMQTESISSMEIRKDAVDDFMEHKNAVMDQMVWSGGCRSWYKNGRIDGPVTGPWCGSTWHFNEVLKNPRWEDYTFKYLSRNRFVYMGNGRTRGELRGDDMATHLREPGAE